MPTLNQPRIQFERAEFGGEVQDLARCARCGCTLDGSRFEFVGRRLCVQCAGVIRQALPADNALVFWRTVGAGALVAAGLTMMQMVVLAHAGQSLGWVLWLAAIGVGWSVGATMRKAAAGAGGRRYQIAGSLLTYIAIVIPLVYAFLPAGDGIAILLFTAVVPVVMLFSRAWNTGFVLLFIAWIGVRWTWQMLKGGPRVIERKTA